MSEKMRKLFMQDWFFIVILAVMGAAILTSDNIYLSNGVGSVNPVSMVLFLKERDWVTLSSLGVGFFLARLLEAPMVGVLDIGGGMMVSIGTFFAGMIGIFGYEFIMDNFVLSLIVGAILGAGMGIAIMAIRKLIPAGITAGGSDIMMGVGHSMSTYMAPLFIICALGVSIPIGIFAAIGGAIFFAMKKNPVGGVIMGMFVASFIWA